MTGVSVSEYFLVSGSPHYVMTTQEICHTWSAPKGAMLALTAPIPIPMIPSARNTAHEQVSFPADGVVITCHGTVTEKYESSGIERDGVFPGHNK